MRPVSQATRRAGGRASTRVRTESSSRAIAINHNAEHDHSDQDEHPELLGQKDDGRCKLDHAVYKLHDHGYLHPLPSQTSQTPRSVCPSPPHPKQTKAPVGPLGLKINR